MKHLTLLDLEDHEYHAIDAISSHKLMRALRSYEHTLNEVEQTDAMRFGSAVHIACLEPAKFETKVKVLPKLDRRTREGKEQFGALSSLENTILISAEERALCESIQNRFKLLAQTNIDLQKALTNAQFEKSLFWTFEEHLCKCKFDVVSIQEDGHAFIVDLKTTKDALPEAFKFSFRNFHYDLQSVWYEYALLNYCQHNKIDIKSVTCLIVALEKEAPFGAVVYRVAKERAEFLGEQKLQKALSNLINKASSYSVLTQELY